MNKEQIIFLDEIDSSNLSPLRKSLIHEDTAKLNIIIGDGRSATDCALIGNRFEWKPLIWMMYQQDRIKKLDTLKIILIESIMPEHVKNEIRNMFKNVNVKFFDLLLPGYHHILLESQSMARQYQDHKRDNVLYFSAGIMRLPRFVLVHWLQKKQAQNFGHPLLSDTDIQTFTHQLSRLCKKDFSDYENVERRFFGNCDIFTYWQKHRDILLKTKISVVSAQPFFDYLESFYCEKFLHSVACKTLPFFIGNKNDNENVKDLGFKPYVGFDYSSESIDNFVERWQKLLDDNSHFLLQQEHASEIMEKNREIIQYNFDVLVSTDWKKKAYEKISMVSGPTREFLKELFFENDKIVFKNPPTR